MMLVMLAALTLLNPVADWELLGTRRVSFTLDHDAIIVGARQGAYSAIKIEVAGGVLEMYNVRVTFGDGETWSPPTRFVFRQGSWSRTIDLPGPARLIRRIDFAYRSRPRRGAATVRVFGGTATLVPAEPPAVAPPVDQSVAPAAPPPATPPPATPPPAATPPAPPPPSSILTAPPPPAPPAARGEEWEHLACRPVNVNANRDSVVDMGDTPFRAIRFDVDSGNLELYDVKVTFAKGETHSPQVRITFNANTRSASVGLPGDPRPVRRIEYSYRVSSGLFANTQAKTTVHVYGLR